MRELLTRNPVVTSIVGVVVIALAVTLFVVLGGSSPSTPVGPNSVSQSSSSTVSTTTTTYTPPVTNTPGSATQVSKNEAVFIAERVGAEVTALNGAKPITLAIVDKAIAKTTGAQGMTATVVGGVVTLKEAVSLGGETGYACATFSAATLKTGMRIINCP